MSELRLLILKTQDQIVITLPGTIIEKDGQAWKVVHVEHFIHHSEAVVKPLQTLAPIGCKDCHYYPNVDNPKEYCSAPMGHCYKEAEEERE